MPTHDQRVSILFVHYGQPWIRGSEQCLLDLLSHIDREKFALTVVCNQPMLASEIEKLGVHATVVPEAGPAKIIASRNQVRVLREAADRCDAQIIHANSSVIVPALVRVARGRCIPLLAHLHIVPDASERRHELLHQVSMIVGVSQHSIEGFVDEGMPEERVTVVHNAVDGQRIQMGDATRLRESLGISERAFVAVTLGSLIERKAHHVAIRAVAATRQLNEDVQLIVCGSGEEAQALRDLAAELGISNQVHFVGFRDDAGAVLRDAADVLLAPSRMEALPLNVLEAQWFGIPVIASDIAPHREALLDHDPLSFVALNDHEAFARALITLRNDNTRRERARKVTQAVARKHYAMNRYVRDFETTYTTLVRAPRRQYGWWLATRWPAVYSQWLREIVAKRVR